ncbi:response regulator [Sphingomonas morindae]|uniref:Response regulator n=1 Tax=Sphingomonas morindae TaxID=1541170 RepID=A0ABY4X5K3_9SPHN|nr:response regulator [Sphingomonas morindae]USI72179.1 response regulator [Sphingomonas morindae]
MFGLGRGKWSAGKRILIVEDEPLVAFDNEHFLVDRGFDVVATVDNVDEAVARIAVGGIDCVTADVRLTGGGSGLDVARAAHEAGIPVLLVTGQCPTEAQSFAYGCLAKPYAQRELVEAIEAVLERAAGTAPRRLPRALTLFR